MFTIMAKIHNNARLKSISTGTCSHTMFYLLNESGLRISDKVLASDRSAGGLLLKGYQCGMLRGASLVKAGNYTCKQYTDMNKSIYSVNSHNERKPDRLRFIR
jgi:hypothetical protein